MKKIFFDIININYQVYTKKFLIYFKYDEIVYFVEVRIIIFIF